MPSKSKSLPKARSRIYYCPVHGRVTDLEYEKWATERHSAGLSMFVGACEHCDGWYFRRRPFTAKRGDES